MNRDLSLPTYSSNSDYNADFDYFRVHVSAEFARQMLQRIEMLKAVKKTDSSCFKLVFWDSHGDYFSGSSEGEHDPAQTPQRSECEQMVVMDDGICWTALPKHSDGIEISTEHLNIGQLTILAKED
jgi:hypothetical protein